MKRHCIQSALLTSYFLFICASIPWLASAATGDIIFSYKGANGQTQSVVTPSTSTDVLALNGSGLVTKVARSTWLTPSGDGSALTGLTKSQVGLGSVENTALSTWAGSSNLTTFSGGTFGTAAASAATAFEVPLTFSTGLTRSTNTVTVNTSQNIATLSNLTGNGFVKTSGGTGALSIDTSTYLTSASSITASQLPALTGDITTSAGAVATTLATVNSNVGSFTNASITVNAKGLVTAASSGAAGATLGANTFTGAQTMSVSGSASTSAILLSGSAYASGTATTTKPLLLVEPSGTTSTGWTTSGTMAGVNAAASFAGKLLDLQLGGASKFSVASNGATVIGHNEGSTWTNILQVKSQYSAWNHGCGSNSYVIYNNGGSNGAIYIMDGSQAALKIAGTGTNIIELRAEADGVMQLGTDHATTPKNYVVKGMDVTTGVGGGINIQGGTGSTAGGAVTLSTAATTTPTVRLTVKASGVVNLSNVPTSSAGLSSGDIYQTAGALMIVP